MSYDGDLIGPTTIGPTTTIDTMRLAVILPYCTALWLRTFIASERESGRAFGVCAEAARGELAKRGEQA